MALSDDACEGGGRAPRLNDDAVGGEGEVPV